jgi:dTDP-4-dehydrorhamnose 3,5-epimerase
VSLAKLDEQCTIPGVRIIPLTTHVDERGGFTEVFRESWVGQPHFVQWNVVSSRAGTLRGVHAHRRHTDYLIVVSGHMWLGLADLRPDAHPVGAKTVIGLDASTPQAVVIPTGVAHGFLFSRDSLHLYAVSDYHSEDDEFGCRWDDPELALPWPAAPEHLSKRDQQAPDLATLRAQLRP